MSPFRNPSSPTAIAGAALPPGAALLAQARALQLAAESGQARPLLRGKNLGLLCEAVDDPDAALLRRAAVELGAQVAHLRPSLSELSTTEDIQHAARVLGRLYDAVACQGVAPALVQQLRHHASVPVHEGIASPNHPAAALAGQLEGDCSPDDKRCFLLQALLLATMG